jgi:hypothetical protein
MMCNSWLFDRKEYAEQGICLPIGAGLEGVRLILHVSRGATRVVAVVHSQSPVTEHTSQHFSSGCQGRYKASGCRLRPCDAYLCHVCMLCACTHITQKSAQLRTTQHLQACLCVIADRVLQLQSVRGRMLKSTAARVISCRKDVGRLPLKERAFEDATSFTASQDT